MAKKRRVLGGALLTAAATALTVKGALTSPIGAAVPSDQIQHDLAAREDAAAAGADSPKPAGKPAASGYPEETIDPPGA